jgi:hypothetical protein
MEGVQAGDDSGPQPLRAPRVREMAFGSRGMGLRRGEQIGGAIRIGRHIAEEVADLAGRHQRGGAGATAAGETGDPDDPDAVVAGGGAASGFEESGAWSARIRICFSQTAPRADQEGGGGRRGSHGKYVML